MIASVRRESILIRKLINERIGIGSEDKLAVTGSPAVAEFVSFFFSFSFFVFFFLRDTAVWR